MVPRLLRRAKPCVRAVRDALVRAPRGENVRRIRAEIEQRPGTTAGEVAAATGIARAAAASTLSKLARGGEFETQALPSGGVGYRRIRKAEPAAKHSGNAAVRIREPPEPTARPKPGTAPFRA